MIKASESFVARLHRRVATGETTEAAVAMRLREEEQNIAAHKDKFEGYRYVPMLLLILVIANATDY